jgi:hypothetical protein
VREFLKITKILKMQEKFKLAYRPRRSLRISWGLRRKMATENSKTIKKKGIVPSGVANFVSG